MCAFDTKSKEIYLRYFDTSLRFYSSGQICGDEIDSLNNVVITSYVNFFPSCFLLFGGIIAVQCPDLIETSDKKGFQ